MSRDDVQRWKDKYLENIEQQERLQRRWDARIDLLRRGLVRSSLAAEGSDKAVDQCMKELREILRRDDMDAGLSGLIPRLEKAVLDSEQRRQQRTQQNIDALGELAQQLLALDLPRELRKPLKQFARDIEERARQSREIPILLSELSRLQRQALAERKGGDAEDGRPSLLQRLFGGKESETAAEPSASVPSVVAASNTPIQPAAAAPSLSFPASRNRSIGTCLAAFRRIPAPLPPSKSETGLAARHAGCLTDAHVVTDKSQTTSKKARVTARASAPAFPARPIAASPKSERISDALYLPVSR